jgi:rhodanese-related sulfurtransferase
MRWAAGAALVASAALLTGCSGQTAGAASSPTTATASAAATTPAAGTSLSAAEFAAAATLPNTVVLDVRTPSEFSTGHIAGAVNLDVRSAGFTRDAEKLDPTMSYAVYCHSGNRSKVAMGSLQQVGISHVFDLAGGITAWQSAGGQVTTD